MFGRWLTSAAKVTPPQGAAEIEEAVRTHLPGADSETRLVVTAVAGLLGVVAYADRSYSEEEERRVRQELERVHGMTAAGVEAICTALRLHIVEVSTVQAPRYARTLVELADRELRVDILEVLVDVAAADGSITLAETNLLRSITTSLGLSQSDYAAAQDRHRDRLAVRKI